VIIGTCASLLADNAILRAPVDLRDNFIPTRHTPPRPEGETTDVDFFPS
jgi:hypothetical protein